MKLAVIIILISSLQVNAEPAFGQTISVNAKNTEVKKILKTIERDGYYRFAYNTALSGLKQKKDISVTGAGIEETMNTLLAGTSLTYKLASNNLVVVLSTNAAEYDAQVVTGRVTDENGQAVANVSVSERGTSNGTTTDNNGNYSLNVASNASLVFSSVGYETQTVAVGGRNVIDVRMQAAVKKIDEVVVIGYGTASKRDLTGSIVKIAGKEVADKPNTNPVASLQGKVAGLSVVNSGVPGEQPDIRIRGTISIGSVNPLYVVDGIFTDNIDYLNPNDIESIEVLKDPSSLAIFGVKGASGVIAVTTKKAKSGQVSITLSANYGTKKLVDKIELASGNDFRKIFAMEAANGLDDPDPTIGIKNTNFITDEMSKWTGNTDWVDAVTRKASFFNTNLSVASATDRNRVALGLGYTMDQGLVKHVEYKKMTLNFSDEFKLHKAIKVGVNFVGSSEKLPLGTGALTDARKTLPIVPSGTKRFAKLRNPYLSALDSASYDLYSTTPVIQNTERNPLLVLSNQKDRTINNRLRGVGSVYADISFLRDFNFRATFYKDLSFGDKREYTPVTYAYNPAALDPANEAFLYNTLSQVGVTSSTQKANQQDYILNYKKSIGSHNFTAMTGTTWYEIGYSDNYILSKQKDGDQPIPDDKRFWYASNGFATPSAPRSNQWEYATVSFMGRLLYNYQNKYYATGTFRRDYASNINDKLEKQGQNFWSLGLGWELTKESFMDNQKLFNFLKLKASMGVLGNFNTTTIGGYYPFYPGVNATQATFGVNTATVFENSYLRDPNLHWETVHAKEVGVEFNMFSNRLHGEISYYNKLTKDLLAPQKTGGVLPTLKNAGEILNKGLEISGQWNQKINNKLTVTASTNLTTFKNKVVSLNEPIGKDPQFPNTTETGQPIGYFFGYVVEGLYQSYADILASPVSQVSGPAAKPGDFKYKDISGPKGVPDGFINDFDQTIIGNPTPDFTYGFGVNVKYGNFDLGVDLSGVYGNEIYRYWSTSEQKNSVYNYPKYFLNAWNGAGTSNWVPIVDAQHLKNRVPSTYGIEDGSYIRIRNLGLGYSFNVNKLKVKSGRVYLNIQNLKTWKHNLGYSPEYGGSALSFGIDNGTAGGALPRIITGGFTITF